MRLLSICVMMCLRSTIFAFKLARPCVVKSHTYTYAHFLSPLTPLGPSRTLACALSSTVNTASVDTVDSNAVSEGLPSLQSAVGTDKGDDDIDEEEEMDFPTGADGTPIPKDLNWNRLKVRQHVNPLSAKYQAPLPLPLNWIPLAFDSPTLPLILDIGCAKGSWALKMAETLPTTNLLGLEIRRPVVELCLARKYQRNLKNVHFLAVNANVDLEKILTSLVQSEV
jgi:hypothetical protein